MSSIPDPESSPSALPETVETIDQQAETHTQDYLSKIEQAQKDLRTLLRFATIDAPVPVDPTIINDAVEVTQLDPKKVTGQLEAKLWISLDKLKNLIYPSTLESIRLVQGIIEDGSAYPGYFRKFWKDADGRREISSVKRWQFLLLVVLIISQVYTLVLTLIIDRFESTYRELQNSLQQATHDLETTSGALEDKLSCNFETLLRNHR